MINNIVSILRNLFISVNGPSIQPMAEIVIVSTENSYKLDPALVKYQKTNVHRYTATSEDIDDIIAMLSSIKRELDSFNLDISTENEVESASISDVELDLTK